MTRAPGVVDAISSTIVTVPPVTVSAVPSKSYIAPAEATSHAGGGSLTGERAGLIEAEDFDFGGEAVAYHDLDATNGGAMYRLAQGVDVESTTDANGGYNVGWTKAGEWLEYTVDVETARSYVLEARVASAGAGGKFHVEIDGVDATGSLTVPNTGGWQAWTAIATSVDLTAGRHVLRLYMDAAGSAGHIGNFSPVRRLRSKLVPELRGKRPLRR